MIFEMLLKVSHYAADKGRSLTCAVFAKENFKNILENFEINIINEEIK